MTAHRRTGPRVTRMASVLVLAVVTLIATPAAAASRQEVIVLPGAASAEGIATGSGTTFYAGDLARGDIFRGDFRRGRAELLVDAPEGRMAVGMKFHQRSGLLFVAGGFGGHAYVYDAATGATVAMYQFTATEESIVNDVVITRDGAWFTDSRQANLYFLPIGPCGELGRSRVLPLSGPAADTSGFFNLNGIVATPDGSTLIVAHSTSGALYRVDPNTGASAPVSGVAVPGADGLVLDGRRLWVVQGTHNQVSRVSLRPDLTKGRVEKVITSPLFDGPTTAAPHGGRLAVVNARFTADGTPPAADRYEIILVDR